MTLTHERLGVRVTITTEHFSVARGQDKPVGALLWSVINLAMISCLADMTPELMQVITRFAGQVQDELDRTRPEWLNDSMIVPSNPDREFLKELGITWENASGSGRDILKHLAGGE